ncbi:MAG: ATP-binding protein, partial [Planctomycetota bacterium]
DNCDFFKAATTELLETLSVIRRMVSSKATPQEEEIFQLIDGVDLEYLSSELPFALTESLGGLGHIQRIVQAMKEFSYPEPEQPIATDLNRAIEMAVVIASGEWKHVASIVKDFDDDLPWIECHPGTIKQVILNLVVNASHAIAEKCEPGSEERGKITIQTRYLDEEQVEIRVIDTGCGIPKKNLDSVCKPFFTTKPLGMGTGQGLALSQKMVTLDHNGSLNIESEEGEGTTIIIRLPVKAQTVDLQEA